MRAQPDTRSTSETPKQPIQPQPLPAELLQSLSPQEREMLQEVLRNHPTNSPRATRKAMGETAPFVLETFYH